MLLLRSDSFPQWQCLRETVSGTFDWSNRSGAYPVVIFVDPVRISPYKSYLARGRALFLQRLIDRYGPIIHVHTRIFTHSFFSAFPIPSLASWTPRGWFRRKILASGKAR